MEFHWNPRAEREIPDPALRKDMELDLAAAFSQPRAQSVIISDVFTGYRSNKAAKAILGVQVRYEDVFAMHIVKVGLASEVAGDAENYHRCMVAEGMASRLLMRVTGHERPPDRYIVVYEDAYQLFGAKEEDSEKPETLEQIVAWAIKLGDPDVASVERVITQIYRELNRCFYRNARAEPGLALDFYKTKLRWQQEHGVWSRWTTEKDYRELRRHAIWLTSANWKPEEAGVPGYLDPIEYMDYIFRSGQVPSTLVGRSHGDLHGRNILAGLSRGEAEQPVVFDYGDMGWNIAVWDFVKLEIELKCYLLHEFRTEPKAKAALDAKLPPLRKPVQSGRQPVAYGTVAGQVDRMEFACQFERLLAYFTKEIVDPVTAQASGAAADNLFTDHEPLNRALRILLRVRQEAAIWLGYNRDRGGDWAAEYYLGLMVYGMLTAKWNWVAPRQEWALITAGVAASQLGEIQGLLTNAGPPPHSSLIPPFAMPSYLIVQKWARQHWNDKQAAAGAELLDASMAFYPEAVPLRAEYALCLAACGRYDEVAPQLESLSHLCEIFRDYEFLSRFGKSLKNEGDKAWGRDPHQPSLQEVIATSHAAANFYRQAYDQYYKAYEFSQEYFPGINAATLALLHGQEARSRDLAAAVAETCRDWRYTNPGDQFWVFATKGEAALLLQSPREALMHYDAASSIPGMQWAGQVNSLYEQLCRLYWALGPDAVEPVVQLLERKGLLGGVNAGPFGNCGRAVHRSGASK